MDDPRWLQISMAAVRGELSCRGETQPPSVPDVFPSLWERPSFVNFSQAGNNKDIISILRILSIVGKTQKNAPAGVKK